jgi:uncharacterized protein (TIGR02680 family)
MTVHTMAARPSLAEDDAPPVRVAPNRWRPERAGLLNVWQFGNEVLRFDHGRAVLFGPNGSGKTMALELLLPYLLDGDGQPARLSTSGGAERGGFWSRITGYDDTQPRTGYLWLEFMRSSGEAFTCGVRLRANASEGGERHWFTTTRRIGHDLHLLDSGSRPIGPQVLRDALGTAGTVFADAQAYRAVVRQTLFPGRTEDQLEALIRTLLVVRKQNVSDGLSPERLSALLSQALPPLDELELGKVAEGFADLDRRRDYIAGLDEDLRVVGHLVTANQTYARHVTAGVVQRVVGATTDLDNVTRTLRKQELALSECEQQLKDLAGTMRTLDEEASTLEGERYGIEQSEAYRTGSQLADVQRTLAEHAEVLRRAKASLVGAIAVRDQRMSELQNAKGEAERAQRQVQDVRRELVRAVEKATGPETAGIADESLAGIVRGWSSAREEAVRRVRAKLQEHRRAADRRDAANAVRLKSAEELDIAERKVHEAEERVTLEEARWRGAVEEWRSGLHELSAYLELDDNSDDAAATRARVAHARAHAREPLIEARAACQRSRGQASARLVELAAELAEWRAGREPEPEAPTGRRSRELIPGAPLYRLLEFSDDLDGTERGRVESALIASGLLDAWVSPDGTITLGEEGSDVFAVAREQVPGVTNGDVPLVPDPNASAAERGLAASILASITWVARDAHLGVAAASLVIGRDGSWRTPHLAGRAPEQPARFVGASSREAARRDKIDALEHERDALGAERLKLDAAHEVLEQRLKRCDEEARVFPSSVAFEAAVSSLSGAEALAAERRRVSHDRDLEYRRADEEARECLGELMRVASEHSLPTTGEELEVAESQARRIAGDATSFERSLARRATAQRDEVRALASVEDAAARTADAEESQRAAELVHAREEAKFAALKNSVGKSFQEQLSRLETIRSRVVAIREENRTHQRTQLTLTGLRASYTGDVERAQTEREAAAAARDTAHVEYLDLHADGVMVAAGIVTVPDPKELETMTAQLESARRVRADAAIGVPPSAAELNRVHARVQQRLHEATQRMAGRVSLTFEPQERSWSVLRARQDGDKVSGTALRTRLHEDRERARAELDQKQQELFEEVLTGSLREHLRVRLWSARALVDRINTILDGIRSAASGVGVSLTWEIDPNQPEAVQLRGAKKLLLSDSPMGDGRAELDTFLRSRIEQIRADDGDTGEWRARLERVFDYRDWHRFEVHVHHKRFGEQPRPLRSRKVSLSAGEKTIVMVLPLIVAVVAHYEPASDEPPCESPRLLLMDELFPKLDFDNKAQLMGLLPTLQLDGVFTSDKDRCEYAALDGIAIHLFQKLDDDQTTTTRMVWNGKSLRVTPDSEVGPG